MWIEEKSHSRRKKGFVTTSSVKSVKRIYFFVLCIYKHNLYINYTTQKRFWIYLGNYAVCKIYVIKNFMLQFYCLESYKKSYTTPKRTHTDSESFLNDVKSFSLSSPSPWSVSTYQPTPFNYCPSLYSFQLLSSSRQNPSTHSTSQPTGWGTSISKRVEIKKKKKILIRHSQRDDPRPVGFSWLMEVPRVLERSLRTLVY